MGGEESPHTVEPPVEKTMREPLWSRVSAMDGQDFYECKIRVAVIRPNPVKGEEKNKVINIKFYHTAEFTLVSENWVRKEGLKVYPIEPAVVMLPIGQQVESRQIAVVPLVGVKEDGEPAYIAA